MTDPKCARACVGSLSPDTVTGSVTASLSRNSATSVDLVMRPAPWPQWKAVIYRPSAPAPHVIWRSFLTAMIALAGCSTAGPTAIDDTEDALRRRKLDAGGAPDSSAVRDAGGATLPPDAMAALDATGVPPTAPAATCSSASSCPGPANGTSTCVAGVCGFTCTSQYVASSTGCELATVMRTNRSKTTAALVSPATHFATPLWPLLAYDTVHRRTTLFGGMTADRGAVGTWAWNGSDWTMAAPPQSGPSARSEHAMAYDAARGKLVLFGGLDCPVWGVWGSPCHALGDTWEFDGTAWTRPALATGPSARSAHAMTYDPIQHRVLLHGGRDGAGNLLGDLWGFSGTAWTRIDAGAPSTVAPSNRSYHAMAVDPADGSVFVYGGAVAGFDCPSEDFALWRYDSAWERAESSPFYYAYDKLIGKGASLIYDGSQASLVLYGGDYWTTARAPSPSACQNGTVVSWGSPWFFRFNTQQWDTMPVTGAPPNALQCRHCGLGGPTWDHHGVAYDAWRGRLVMYGGFDSDGSSGVWEVTTTTVGDRAPVLAPIPDRQVYPGRQLRFYVSATDPDHDALTFSATGLPPGATLFGGPQPGFAEFSFSPAVQGEHDVTFVASDGSLSVSQTSHIHVGEITYAFAPRGTVSVRGSSTITGTEQYPDHFHPENRGSVATTGSAACVFSGSNPGEALVDCSVSVDWVFFDLQNRRSVQTASYGPVRGAVGDDGAFRAYTTLGSSGSITFSGQASGIGSTAVLSVSVAVDDGSDTFQGGLRGAPLAP